MLKLLLGCLAVITIAALLLFSLQESLLFHPEKLVLTHAYTFSTPHTELNFHPEKNVNINALLFKAGTSKGLVFYLHGNAGNLESWGSVAPQFVALGYDVLIMDYRGYGKSTGKISEKALVADAQFLYDQMKGQYAENKIVIYGRSIGTGIAAYLAAHNKPAKLLLEAPFYNMQDLAGDILLPLPKFMLRYSFPTNELLPDIACPVYVFHGTDDEVIYYGSSVKLQKLFKTGDTLYSIQGGQHNNLESFPEFQTALKQAM